MVYGQQVPEEPANPPAEVQPEPAAAPAALDDEQATSGFTVRLDNFTGPFDLLLQLIGKHKLDVTEVALHQVTDDFIAYIRAMGDDWDLDEASEFLLVAATLLDLKAARLLPAAEVEDEDDLALLEARDLLFARLLQYKAFKEAAAYLSDLEGTGAKRYPRAVSMEPRYAEALPDLVLGIGVERLFKLALKQFTPKPGPPTVSIAHIHQMRVSVREHAALLLDRLRRAGSATFTLLVADCENTLEVVARFLALLELYREGLIDFEQPVSLDELTVRWIGGDAPDADLDIDDYEGSRPDPDAPPPDDPDAPDPAAAESVDLDADAAGLDLEDADLEDVDPGSVDLDADSAAVDLGADSAVVDLDGADASVGADFDEARLVADDLGDDVPAATGGPAESGTDGPGERRERGAEQDAAEAAVEERQ
ncbi:segregation/condensation protein A [Paractinoplanes rishiriensis]|uniref:segregation and condensation protein A n=1 Tax=Paractinoplanes rishiriensis TaxID=1050105 RepID=UPI001943AE79